MGKTMLCKLYKDYLSESLPVKYKSVIIDAFLHDYVDEPFIPIHQAVSELDELLGRKRPSFKIDLAA